MRTTSRCLASVCVCWPWPRLVIIDNIASIYICVCVFWPWPRWLLCVLCVIVCVCLNGKPWPRLVILTMTCKCVLALASVGYY